MDSTEPLSNKQPEEIRHNIETTRESLADKIGTLTDKVGEAKAAVEQKLTLAHHVRQNPWGAVMGAVGVGFLVGHALTTRHEPRSAPSTQPNGSLISGAAAGLASGGMAQALTSLFDEEIKMALGTALDAIWGEAKQMMPGKIAQPVDRLFDRVYRKLTRVPSMRSFGLQ